LRQVSLDGTKTRQLLKMAENAEWLKMLEGSL
jgi:hypothetical protein